MSLPSIIISTLFYGSSKLIRWAQKSKCALHVQFPASSWWFLVHYSAITKAENKPKCFLRDKPDCVYRSLGENVWDMLLELSWADQWTAAEGVVTPPHGFGACAVQLLWICFRFLVVILLNFEFFFFIRISVIH